MLVLRLFNPTVPLPLSVLYPVTGGSSRARLINSAVVPYPCQWSPMGDYSCVKYELLQDKLEKEIPRRTEGWANFQAQAWGKLHVQVSASMPEEGGVQGCWCWESSESTWQANIFNSFIEQWKNSVELDHSQNLRQTAATFVFLIACCIWCLLTETRKHGK